MMIGDKRRVQTTNKLSAPFHANCINGLERGLHADDYALYVVAKDAGEIAYCGNP